MSILKEHAANEHHNGVILPFWAWKKRRNKHLKMGANFVKIWGPNGLASFASRLASSAGGLASSAGRMKPVHRRMKPVRQPMKPFRHLFLLFRTHCPMMIFLQKVNYHFEDTKSIMMNYFMNTLKFDNSPCGEISTSPTQRCVVQTGSHTSHDSMFRWIKCFKEART